MRIDPELIGAWLDGELPAEEARRVDEAVAADPALADEVAALRSGDRLLRSAFDQVDPIDDALLAMLGLAGTVGSQRPKDDKVIEFPGVRAEQPAPRAVSRWTASGGRLAASVAAFAFIGLSGSTWLSHRPATVTDGTYVALSDRTDAPRADALVVLRDGVDAISVIGPAGGRLVGPRTSAGAWRVASTTGGNAALITKLRSDDRVLMAEPMDAGDRQ
jgi:Putative zinc-finger